nr:hypothetical protein A5482_03495 [Cyanobacterium sp. IPPAS B-1200]
MLNLNIIYNLGGKWGRPIMLWASGKGLRASDKGLRASDKGLRVSGKGLRVSGKGLKPLVIYNRF